MRRHLLVLVAALVLAGPAAAATITVGPKANGTTVRIHVLDVLTVTLPSNPGTGYSWELWSMRGGIGLTSATYTPKKVNPGIVGAGGTESFDFVGRVRGPAALMLVYVGPGRAQQIGQRFRLNVVVR
jgi:inhibitor of cysteine peptidase